MLVQYGGKREKYDKSNLASIKEKFCLSISTFYRIYTARESQRKVSVLVKSGRIRELIMQPGKISIMITLVREKRIVTQ